MTAEEQAVWDYAHQATARLSSFVLLAAVTVLCVIFGAVQMLKQADPS